MFVAYPTRSFEQGSKILFRDLGVICFLKLMSKVRHTIDRNQVPMLLNGASTTQQLVACTTKYSQLNSFFRTLKTREIVGTPRYRLVKRNRNRLPQQHPNLPLYKLAKC